MSLGGRLQPNASGGIRPQPVSQERPLQSRLLCIRSSERLQLEGLVDDGRNTGVTHSAARVEPMKAICYTVSEAIAIG